MGLSDIDEDEPVTHSPTRPIVLAPPSAATAAVVPTGTPLYDERASTKINRQFSPCASASAGSVLDDLFGSVDISASPSSTRANASPVSTSSPNTGKPVSTTAAAAPSVLDDLFAAPAPPAAGAGGVSMGADKQNGHAVTESHAVLYVDGNGSGAGDDGTNLLDLSKGAKKDKYHNAESFLDAFERQGKKGAVRGDEGETLAHLTRNKDDNKVRARLLALMNYYDVLGVAQTASEEEIKRSYKKKALELHPDRVGRGQTQEEAELFKVITKAHEVLTDAEQRRKYDESLSGGQPVATSANDWWGHVNM
ncbi:Dnaj protein-like protein [Leptomonas pyrrhocoris]|uniref:Dnaj protein-like protein n=1 Tax=Leptomonas pyrrhocoris TaxID=157538 RepID=A0A0M9G0T7_LEPPY|nr:Dnaj protein-like protein [Leptomonas pyrrhocoris]XP_015658353.1 Dnaj protein-like protein [Leptomonas pyrrhocoris]KPA79913.1 Dnaj protein-like protein [Leptomonas pyrrhocoris]KPA79914.1 Dnaj protein-like protein [Leptomonas pyrrhocoris]|eukprot:XP_015658352.1 Dnaj protein-like protein [Leptomonas pyrrhocoris]